MFYRSIILLLISLSSFTSCQQNTEQLPVPSGPPSQMERLYLLRSQGQFLSLVVGRTPGETANPPLISSNQNIWVYADRNPTLHTGHEPPNSVNDPIVLTIDFADAAALSAIQDQTFDQIIVDGSTWKFLVQHIETSLPHYYRLLKPNGRLFFEKAMGLSRVHEPSEDPNIQYDFRTNPNAVIGMNYPLERPWHTIDARAILNQLKIQATIEVGRRYQIYFCNNIGFRQFISHSDGSGYPIVNSRFPIESYFEAIK